MYKVIKRFTDSQDNKHVYEVGDEYPRKGHKPSEARINELMTESNKRGEALIAEVKEEKAQEEKPKKKKATKKKGE